MDDMKLIEYHPIQTKAVAVPPKTLTQYMLEKKERKVRNAQKTTIRGKIVELMRDLSGAGIRYKTPRKLYGKRYTQKMWSGYYSYLISVAREAV